MFVFQVGNRAKVINPQSPHFNKEGTVTAVNYAGQTNSEPPTFFGEIDSVKLDGSSRANNFDVNELQKIS
jgi:hypothetical protein